MIKVPWLSILSFTCLISCKTEHILLDNHMGIVMDKTTNKPIIGALIYTDSIAFDYFEPVISKDNGYFFTPGLIIPHYDKGYIWRRQMSYTLIFRSEGYVSDTLDVRSFPDKSNETLDTIDLGIIYLTPVQ